SENQHQVQQHQHDYTHLVFPAPRLESTISWSVPRRRNRAVTARNRGFLTHWNEPCNIGVECLLPERSTRRVGGERTTTRLLPVAQPRDGIEPDPHRRWVHEALAFLGNRCIDRSRIRSLCGRRGR